MFYWHTVTDVIELDMHGPGVKNEPAAWVSAPEYALVGRDANGVWRRWTFAAGENVRVVWSPTGTRAKIDVPEDASLDAPSREDLLELGASEWMIEMPR